MARTMMAALAGGAAALALAAVASAAGARRFRRRFEAEKAELLRRGRAAPPPTPSAVAALPAPVRRYLEVTGTSDAPPLRVAVVSQRGALRVAPDRPWMPFEAEQAYALEPPGFVWLARARVAPLVRMLARDRFVDGEGRMRVTLLGVVTVADARGPELDLGAGLRYWGEIIAFPEAVRSPRLRWEGIDARRARMRADHDGLALAAVVEFDDEGLPVRIDADRFRDVDGKPVLTAWSGHSREWKLVGGRRFPTRWESVWHLPEGDFLAVRMEVSSLRAE